MTSNYPPGVTDWMIPGNRPEDEKWETAIDLIFQEADRRGLTPDEIRGIWELGLQTYDDLPEIERRKVGSVEEEDLNDDTE